MNEKSKQHESDDRSSEALDGAHASKEVTFTEFCECFRDKDRQETLEESEDSDHGEDDDEHNVQEEDTKAESKSCLWRMANGVLNFCRTYEFPILILLVIPIAKAYPPLGATYLAARITAIWIAVMLIFLFSGLGLRTEELSRASKRIYFNCFVQVFNFFAVSAVVFGISRLLASTHILDQALADGMLICSCMPMAINVVIVLTANAGGDDSAAVFNAALGHLIGIFLSPALLLMYLGESGSVQVGIVIMKLCLQVLLPFMLGQILQKIESIREFYQKHNPFFKKFQEYSLVFIVYAVFCESFESQSHSPIGQVLVMVIFQFLLLASFMVVTWYVSRLLFRKEPGLWVVGMFGGVQKSMSFGIPLITSIYEGESNLGMYTLPLLVWHPMQLVVGSSITPWLKKVILSAREQVDSKESDATEAGDAENPAENDCSDEREQKSSMTERPETPNEDCVVTEEQMADVDDIPFPKR